MRLRSKMIAAAALVAVLAGGVALNWSRSGALHEVAVGRFPMFVAADPRSGHVFVVNEGDGRGAGVSMLDQDGAAVLRTAPTGVFPHAVAFDARRGRLFVATNTTALRMPAPQNGGISVLDTRTGAVVRTIAPGVTPIDLGADEATGRLVAALQNGRVDTFDTATSRRVGTVKIGTTAGPLAVDVRGGHVFVIARAGKLPLQKVSIAMLDARDGRLVRTLPGVPYPYSIAVAGRAGRVFVGGNALITKGPCGPMTCRYANVVAMFDARTGRALGMVAVGPNPDSIAVSERFGRAYVLSMNADGAGGIGTVSVLDARTGRVLRATTVGYQPGAAAVDDAAGRVYVTNGNSGTVSVLDAASGRLARTFAVRRGPGAVAVDGVAGRLYVASADVSNSAGGNSNAYYPNGIGVMDRVTLFAGALGDAIRIARKGQGGTVSTYAIY